MRRAVMGRSWRSFLRRSKEEPERSGTAVETPEREPEEIEVIPEEVDGAPVESVLEPVDESVVAPPVELAARCCGG